MQENPESWTIPGCDWRKALVGSDEIQIAETPTVIKS